MVAWYVEDDGPDVRHDATHRQRSRWLLRGDGRIIQVTRRAEGVLACLARVLGEGPELQRRQVLHAEELQVVVLDDIVDQARVESTQRVYVPSSVIERRGRFAVAGGRVVQRPVRVVVDVRGGHQRGLDLRGASVRVAGLDQRSHSLRRRAGTTWTYPTGC